MKYDLGWGNSIAIRQAFLETYRGEMIVFSTYSLSEFNYPDHHGDPELVQITKQIIKDQTGLEYKHVVLTNGATGGVVIALRAYQQRGAEFCHTRNAPHYLRYPGMIKTSGLKHRDEASFQVTDKSVILLDIPSNPLGLTDPVYAINGTPIVLDGVYLNKVYTDGSVKVPNHDVLVGSYSKLTGINGLRIGWIATNDDLLVNRIKELVTSEYCGIDASGTTILKRLFDNFDWNIFERKSRLKLDYNREEWSKLEKFFGNKPIPDVGMFYYAPVDAKCKELLKKASIHYTDGALMGTDSSFGRFNLGQDPEMIRKATKAILKVDKVR